MYFPNIDRYTAKTSKGVATTPPPPPHPTTTTLCHGWGTAVQVLIYINMKIALVTYATFLVIVFKIVFYVKGNIENNASFTVKVL